MARIIFSYILLIFFIASPAFSQENIAKGSLNKSEKLLPLTNDFLEEALGVSDECKAYDFTNTRYDCDCVGMTFLDLRRKKGLNQSRFWLREDAQRKCPNAPAMAGRIYQSCIQWAPMQRGEDYQEFCSCYGSSYAKIYQKNPSENLYIVESQMIKALTSCDVNAVNRKAQDRDLFIKQLKQTGQYDLLFPNADAEN